MSDTATPSAAQSTTQSVTATAALQRCLDAWDAIYLPARAKGESHSSARYDAAPAYLAAMPRLTSPHTVSDFIACTAHGLVIGAIDEKRAAKLLYAAQVASGAFRQQAAPATVAKPAPERKTSVNP